MNTKRDIVMWKDAIKNHQGDKGTLEKKLLEFRDQLDCHKNEMDNFIKCGDLTRLKNECMSIHKKSIFLGCYDLGYTSLELNRVMRMDEYEYLLKSMEVFKKFVKINL